MNEQPSSATVELANKIARLVEERGWNQEEFARIARLNRHTVRQILHPAPRPGAVAVLQRAGVRSPGPGNGPRSSTPLFNPAEQAI